MEGRKEGGTSAPAPSDRRSGRAGTCLSSEKAVEEASLRRRVGAVHVQVGAERPVRLVHVDLLEALHLDHLRPGGGGGVRTEGRRDGWIREVQQETGHVQSSPYYPSPPTPPTFVRP